MTSTISSKGQITVPKAVRDRLGLRPGTTVVFEPTADGVLLRKGDKGVPRPVDRVRGILGRRTATDAILDDMRGPVPASGRRRR
jgi:antitoxin PrlF